MRKRYALAGGRWITSAAILGWHDGVALIRSTLTGEQTKVEADTLVLAETPVAIVGLAEDLRAQGAAFHAIGDCVAPRRASLAFLEGRELALRL